MMNEQDRLKSAADANRERLPYVKPQIKRVELALEETLSSGCKVGDDDCATFIDEAYIPTSSYGS
jgi:hypothetical protein